MKQTLALLSLLLLLTGCFEIEQTIDIRKDLSGTADFHLGVDLEPMVVVMAQVAREMEGKSGPVTPEELAKAKAEFKKKSTTSTTKEPTKEDLAKGLPEGVKLLDYKVKERDFGMSSDFRFAFDKLSALTGVKLPSKSEGGDPTDQNIIDTPFQGLELSETKDTITIRAKPQNPNAAVEEKAKEGPGMNPEMEKMVRQAFEKMKIVYRIKAPFEIVSHNAMRREGNTLIWEYSLETFEEMERTKRLDDAQLRVTYRR